MEIKKEHQDKVLFFRLGDFYEMFNEDAEKVSKLLNLTLTHRGQMPMCGIPFHAAKNYLKRLLDYGVKVAVCEQFLDPNDPNKLARREVTQVYTPATVVDDEYLDSLSSSFVCALNADRKGIYLAWTDISTGEFKIRTFPLEKDLSKLESQLIQLEAKEILVPDDLYFGEKDIRAVIDSQKAIVSKLPVWYFSLKDGKKQTERQFSSNALRLFGLEEKDGTLTVIGALLSYLSETTKTELPQLRVIERVTEESFLGLNTAAIKNLEILNSLQDNSVKYSLFGSLNETITPSGARYLKYALVHPLVDKKVIEKRLDWVESLVNDTEENNRIRHYLQETSDLERLSVKASMKRVVPRDFIAIGESTSAFLSLVENNPRYMELMEGEDGFQFETVVSFALECLKGINKECTNANNEGTIILDGYDEELDELRSYTSHGSEVLSSYVEKLKSETDIQNMKVGENRIIGSYIEVSKGQLDKVPDYFIRRQTLVNGERFTTPELDEIQSKLMSAQDTAAKREREVYGTFVKTAYELYHDLERMGHVITMLDFYSSLAYLARKKNYVRPELLEEGEMEIVDGRHPVVEDHTDRYIANSFSTEKSRFSLITGPNMAGKSTYLREIAIITLLSHVGSFVPATKARIPMTDKIFCRVGASDNLSKGESTFLVEMSESAQILRSCSRRSLVIMDEIGRGTSTQDGMSIAYAIMNYLRKVGSITLFATHYHELTMLDTSGMQLLHMAVKEEKNQVTFLRKAVEGVAESSYGIHVAKLAGLPREVISEANSFQRKHFEDYSSFDMSQGSLFASQDEKEETLGEEIIGMLQDFDTDSSTPLEALMFLADLKKRLK
ncbi:MAG: DNA mismatch repair protein MutS [Spirochaetales bacterium]|nr:DNA mismatch repair protein MutS [Candidatus Physcosoma equi]